MPFQFAVRHDVYAFSLYEVKLGKFAGLDSVSFYLLIQKYAKFTRS